MDAERPASLGSISWQSVVGNVIEADCRTGWTGPSSLLLTVPIDAERIYVFAPRSAGPEVEGSHDLEELGAAFEGFSAPVLEVVETIARSPEEAHWSPIGQGDLAPTMAQGRQWRSRKPWCSLGYWRPAPTQECWGGRFEERRRSRVEWVSTHRAPGSAASPALPDPYLAASIAGRRLW